MRGNSLFASGAHLRSNPRKVDRLEALEKVFFQGEKESAIVLLGRSTGRKRWEGGKVGDKGREGTRGNPGESMEPQWLSAKKTVIWIKCLQWSYCSWASLNQN